MAATLGEAVIEIQADMASMRSDMDQELGKTAPKAGKSVGGKILGTLSSTLKRGAQVAGGVAIAGIGTAMVKGFSRLNAIDQAKAKLSGLGHSAKGVDKIMDNALNAVKGTAFGMGDAATVAAGAVASGIKPGKDLERTLTLMGDAATIAGTDIADMGSVFNKVAAGGKVTGETIQSLTDRGIPILQLLGDQMGTTADETRKMVSDGKVSFDDFQSAIEQGMGGAAQKSGQTFSGALANVQAALGRLGASALSGVFAQLPNLFGKAIETLDGLGPVAERVGTALGGALGGAAERIANIDWAGVGAAVQPLFDSLLSTLGNLKNIAEIILPVLLDIGSAALPVLGIAFGAVVIAVEKVTGALADALGWLEQHETTAKVLAGVLTAVLAPAIAASVGTSVAAWASGAKASVAGSATQIKALYATALGWAKKGAAAVVSGAQSVYVWALLKKDAVVSAATQLKAHAVVVAGWVKQGAAAVASGAKSLYVWALIKKDAVVSAAAAARAQLTLMAAYVRTTAATVAQRGAMLAAAAAAKVTAAAQWLLNAAMTANPIGIVVAALVALGAGLVTAYKRSETFRNIINSGFAAIRDVVAPVINWIAQAVPKTFLRIANVLASTAARARAVVTGAWQAIRVVTAKVFGALAGLVRGSLNKVRAVTASVTGAVRKAITNAWNTARNVTTKTWNAISGAVSKQVGRVVSAVQSIPGKIGRFAGKFRGAGKSLMNALVKGISSVGGVAGDIAKGVGRAVIGVINSLIGKMNNAIPNKIGKGKLSINLPANPIPTISGYARGTNFAPGGVALVGEEGPELVNLPRGSRVYTASQTRNMTSTPSTPSAGSGFPSKVILRVGAREFTAYVEEIADGRIDAADSLAWQGA